MALKISHSLILISIILLALVGSASAALSGYGYGYQMNIINGSSPYNSMTNYPFKVVVSNATGVSSNFQLYTNSSTRPDWGDVNFTDVNDNPIPFWLQRNSTTSTSATFWFNNTASSNANQTRFYFNSTSFTTSASSITKTFPMADDFAGETSLKSGWSKTSALTQTFNNQGSYYTQSVTTSGPFGIYWNTSYPINTSTITNAQFGSNANQQWIEVGNDARAYAGSHFAMISTVGTAGSNWELTNWITSQTTALSGTTADTQWHVYEVQRNAATSTIGKVDGTTWSLTTQVPTDSIAPGIFTAATSGTASINVNWIVNRPFISPEPTTSTILTINTNKPVASFTQNSTNWTNNDVVAFTDTSTQSPNAWSWNMTNSTVNNGGNGTSLQFSTSQNPTQNFGIGNWSVVLIATNTAGSNTSTQTSWVNVSALVSRFTAVPSTAVEPATVTYNDTSYQLPSYINISLGNGGWYNSTWPAANTTSIFSTGGNYTATEYVSNQQVTVSSSQYIQIYNQSNSSFIYSNATNQIAPGVASFTDTSTNTTPTPTYYWDFGDGGTSTSQNPTYVYNAAGIYNVKHSINNGFYTNWTNLTAAVQINSLPAGTVRVFFNATGNTSYTVPPGINTLSDFLSVAGGGAGDAPSGGTGGGGGGGGGLLYGFNLSVVGGTVYNFSVGAGGVGNFQGTLYSGYDSYIWNGSPTSPNIIAVTHAIGGGHGGDTSNAANGGSGGGIRIGTAGTGTAGQGHNGYGTQMAGSPFTAGGGGGAGNDTVTSNGGADAFFWLSGINTPYSGGGGGGSYAGTAGSGSPFGTGGYGGHNIYGGNGVANSGGGGGGAGSTNNAQAGSGGSGTIIITYLQLPLTSSFTVNATSGVYPPLTQIQFTDTSQGGPVDWNYTFTNVTGNNTPTLFSTLQNPVQGFGIGNFSISLKTQNSTGTLITSSQVTFINVSTSAVVPTASFTGTPTSGIIPMNVSFTDTSAGIPTSWLWNFGDGGSSTAQNPYHVYNNVGQFTVNETVTNTQGSSNVSMSNYITVNVMTATVTANVTTGYNSVPVHFTGSSTGTPNTWYWMLGSGHGTSTAQNPPDQTYTVGTYQINFSATNTSSGYTAWNNLTTITVINNPIPISSFTASPSNSYVPMTVQFTDTSLFGPTSWNWSFGNGVYSTQQNPQYTYNVAGNYQVNLTATNAAGSNTSVLKYIYASAIPLAPQANFTAQPTTFATMPSVVNFTDTSTQSPSSWYWSNFGDGSGATSLLQNPTHSYAATGSYPVTLSVTNANGTPSSITKYINIVAGNGGVTDYKYTLGSVTYENLSGYGTYAWTCPSGVYSVNLLMIGGGAAGTNGGTTTGVQIVNFNSTGGQQGGNQQQSNIPVIPGQVYQFVVGQGGQNVNTTANVVNNAQGTVTYIYRGGALYSTSIASFFGASTTYQSTDTLAGLATTAFGYTAPGGLAGMYQINAGWGGANYNGVLTTPTNGITSPASGVYVTYGGSGGGFNNTGGTSGGGNGYGNSWISTAGSFYGAGGGAGDLVGGTIDSGKSGSNGVIILNYQQQAVILPPVVNFTGTPLTGYPPLTVQFTDYSSNGPTQWNWGFGDGTNSTLQNPSHVYTTNGTYSVSLIATNINGTSSLARASYIVVNNIPVTATPTPAPGSNQVWFVPKTVHYYVVNAQTGAPIIGANVSAQFLSSSGLPGGLQDLINYYGMNQQAANNAANGTLWMNSTTDSAGFVVLTQLQTLQYGVLVTSNGVSNYFTINPQNPEFTLRFNTGTTVDTSLSTCVMANQNTWTSAMSNPNADKYHMYLLFSYQDTCGLTSQIQYFVIDKGTDASPINNLLYSYTLNNPGTSIATNNVSVPNTRGENYAWYMNYTRSV